MRQHPTAHSSTLLCIDIAQLTHMLDDEDMPDVEATEHEANLFLLLYVCFVTAT